ncbi:MAG TPA: gluconate transporter [Clostridiales bacterium]|nr:gluconate transporter [Clostridiales bacterium]
MSGIPLIIAFVIAIALMIYAISKLKIHPFLSIMAISLIFGIIAGIPLADLPNVIGTGFSNTFKSIGIVIIFGALIGTLLEKTGAALKMADVVVRLVGKKRPELAMLLMGWIVSIPVFCDSGFVILNPIRKALVKRTARSSVASTVASASGHWGPHCFIPPTPGPIAAANTLYEGAGQDVNLLYVIIIGILASILPLVASYLFALHIGKKVKSKEELNADDGEIVQTYEELVASYGKLPNAWLSFAPIVVPIILMSLASAFAMAGISIPIIAFLGTPIIAIASGVLFALYILIAQKRMGDFYKFTDETLKISGPILFITAAGGVLGTVIANTTMVDFIKENSTTLAALGLMFPFLLSAILKTAQGSSTVALTTTAGIVAPMLSAIGLDAPILIALTVIAIGAGAMTVSHANDSYFWVVTNFGNMRVEDGYKTQTLGTLIVGIAGLINAYIIYFFVR